MSCQREGDDSMKLWEYIGKQIKLTTVNGRVFEGTAQDYISELDNPDGMACISIGDIEFEEREIEQIVVVSSNIPILAHAI